MKKRRLVCGILVLPAVLLVGCAKDPVEAPSADLALEVSPSSVTVEVGTEAKDAITFVSRTKYESATGAEELVSLTFLSSAPGIATLGGINPEVGFKGAPYPDTSMRCRPTEFCYEPAKEDRALLGVRCHAEGVAHIEIQGNLVVLEMAGTRSTANATASFDVRCVPSGGPDDGGPEDAGDASYEDASQDVGGDDSGLDAESGSEAATDAPVQDAIPDGAECAWLPVDSCDTGGTIAAFCPGTIVTLKQCVGGLYDPDSTYLEYHLCGCDYQQCGCSGVVWSEVLCCS